MLIMINGKRGNSNNIFLQKYKNRSCCSPNQGLSPVVALLDADYSEVQQSALTCIARCARNSENISAFVEMGVMEKLIAFVSIKENRASYVFALNALSAILQEPGAVARLALVPPPSKGSEPAPAPLSLLVSFVSNSDEAVQISALSCIANACSNAASRSVLLEFKAEAALVARLLSEDAKAPFTPALTIASARAVAAICKGRVRCRAASLS